MAVPSMAYDRLRTKRLGGVLAAGAVLRLGHTRLSVTDEVAVGVVVYDVAFQQGSEHMLTLASRTVYTHRSPLLKGNSMYLSPDIGVLSGFYV